MNARPRRRTHRAISACILGTVTPLVIGAGVIGMGYRAESAAASTQHARLVALTNPVQCVEENIQCAKDAASGNNPCDPIPC